jgi:tetratricopeptide (TPR) repeat protein
VKAEGRKDILNELDKLATSVRRDLGESLNQVVGRRVHLIIATKPSLEALKLFSEGTVAREHGQREEARTLWTHAVEIDSGFAWANASLGLVADFMDEEDTARKYFDRALSQLDRVTEKERLWITALTKSGSESVDAYRSYLQQYPDDRDG